MECVNCKKEVVNPIISKEIPNKKDVFYISCDHCSYVMQGKIKNNQIIEIFEYPDDEKEKQRIIKEAFSLFENRFIERAHEIKKVGNNKIFKTIDLAKLREDVNTIDNNIEEDINIDESVTTNKAIQKDNTFSKLKKWWCSLWMRKQKKNLKKREQ